MQARRSENRAGVHIKEHRFGASESAEFVLRQTGQSAAAVLLFGDKPRGRRLPNWREQGAGEALEMLSTTALRAAFVWLPILTCFFTST